ncbi:hypothetical protein [Streptomyces sp. NPDC026673]|uniref:hypothetical protein n=1 Tax=Streptomyces sp. NPDC026673 TaxID=3155724 RepID=UPI0033CD19F2
MSDDVRNIVLGLAASGISAALGWFVRAYLWRRGLRRKQRFFGLPTGSECLMVVNRDPGATRGWSVARHDVFALIELSALIKECGAHAEILPHDTAWQGFGARTEFCVGGPISNHRMAAHLRSMLPGFEVNDFTGPKEDQGALKVGGDTYRMDKGKVEYVLLARLAADENTGNSRPVFLASGQRGVNNQAAVRYLARHHLRLSRKYGVDSTFCLLLKVINSEAYGPDVVEVVADVTRDARTPVSRPVTVAAE